MNLKKKKLFYNKCLTCDRLVEILSEQRASTKENVERKQARTDGEREEEDEEVVEVKSKTAV